MAGDSEASENGGTGLRDGKKGKEEKERHK